MNVKDKSKEELLDELARVSEHIAELEAFKARCEQAEVRITTQNEFLNNVLEALNHPFYVLDVNDYSIKIANSAARFGQLSKDKTCYALTHRRTSPCNGSEHTCPLQVVKATKQPFSVEHIHYDREGNPRNVEVHAHPIFDSQGNVAQMIEYSLDITKRKMMEKELENYADSIKLFAYSVSHDLKSPLIGINGLTRLLHKQYREMLDDKAKKYCDQILKASEQVLALIEEINIYIKTKERPLNLEKIKPEKIIDSVREEFWSIISNRGINWSEPENIPEIKADRLCFTRILRNLVDNALKYGGKDMHEIKIEYSESEEFHVFSVTDDGVGIKSEDFERVFGLFQRNESSKQQEGTGLGLAIVKEIAEKHMGKAWLETRVDGGTAFRVAFSKTI